MRKHADQINRALDRLEAGEIRPRAHAPRPRRDLTQEEIATLLRRAGNRSAAPLRDTALVHFLLVTAARPVEVARMQIAHYLHADGTVREYSVLPADMTQSGGERRFVFVNAASVDAIDAYLEDRLRAKGRQPDTSEAYRGFSPSEPLFLNNAGLPFAVVEKAGRKGKRHTSPQMADALAKILGKSGLQGIQLETLRHILAARLRKRGATIKQICEIFGVSGKKSAIRLLPPALTFSELMADIFPGAAGFPDRDPGSH
jgi:integrase